MSGVRLSRVTKSYGPVTAVADISMEIRRGAFTTILGPSGSGKTTILSLIAGITMPSAGRIEIGGRDITDLPAAERNTGLVFQSYALFPHMTIFDNVAFPLRLRGVRGAALREQVAEALRQVRLEGLDRRRPDQLSGGQQQRVALARAIVFKPDILLLDEPLAALDRNLREAVRGEIRALQHRLGITTVMVTHDQDEAMSLSDEIVLMAEGRIEQVGSPETLYHRPATRFAAGFLGSASVLEGRLEGAAIVTGSGERFPAAAAGRPEGATVTGILRPEAVSIAPGAGAVTGRVIDVDFLGEVIRYAVRTPAGQILRAHVSGLHQRLGLGETVHLGWDPARVWLLPDPAGTDPGQPGRDRDLSMDRNFSETERISR